MHSVMFRSVCAQIPYPSAEAAICEAEEDELFLIAERHRMLNSAQKRCHSMPPRLRGGAPPAALRSSSPLQRPPSDHAVSLSPALSRFVDPRGGAVRRAVRPAAALLDLSRWVPQPCGGGARQRSRTVPSPISYATGEDAQEHRCCSTRSASGGPPELSPRGEPSPRAEAGAEGGGADRPAPGAAADTAAGAASAGDSSSTHGEPTPPTVRPLEIALEPRPPPLFRNIRVEWKTPPRVLPPSEGGARQRSRTVGCAPDGAPRPGRSAAGNTHTVWDPHAEQQPPPPPPHSPPPPPPLPLSSRGNVREVLRRTDRRGAEGEGRQAKERRCGADTSAAPRKGRACASDHQPQEAAGRARRRSPSAPRSCHGAPPPARCVVPDRRHGPRLARGHVPHVPGRRQTSSVRSRTELAVPRKLSSHLRAARLEGP
eukprot:TRINITY_DN13702_c0_g1_i1.p1 TRINITY_DN13702_c0_g1~~TRINITY_DN13702_c0_g1_i1.p1  ORF type:complete len:469 (+),score=126.05 TRINITY_DN13702_c0_g1_i1:125-1408(+)